MTNEKNDLWFFCNLVTKKQMGPFPLITLCTFIINENLELDQILLYQSGWPKWKKSLELPLFLNQYLKLHNEKMETLPPIENFDSDSSIIEVDNEEDCPPMIPVECQTIIKKDKIEMRKHARVPLALKAVFIYENKSFRTRTQDVSLGGIKIIDQLPDIYCNRKIQVFLSSPDHKFSIKFEAELLSNTSSLTHLQFDSNSEIGLKQLETWLSSMNKNQLQSA